MLSSFSRYSVLAVTILTTSSAVIAKEVSYDFIQGSFLYTSVESETGSGDVNGKGQGVSVSFSVLPHIALNAGYGSTKFNTFQGVDVDTTSFSYGVTAYTSVSPGMSIFADFSVLEGDVEASDGFTTIDDDDTGNIISVGFRNMATDAIEISAGFSHASIFDDTENTFGAGARFYSNEKFSLGIGYATSSDADAYSLNARFDFK